MRICRDEHRTPFLHLPLVGRSKFALANFGWGYVSLAERPPPLTPPHKGGEKYLEKHHG